MRLWKLGMISHKKSLITIFGHKHEIKNFIKKFDIFLEKIGTAFDFDLYMELNCKFWITITLKLINEFWTKWQLWPKNVINQILQSLYNFFFDTRKRQRPINPAPPLGSLEEDVIEEEREEIGNEEMVLLFPRLVLDRYSSQQKTTF